VRLRRTGTHFTILPAIDDRREMSISELRRNSFFRCGWSPLEFVCVTQLYSGQTDDFLCMTCKVGHGIENSTKSGSIKTLNATWWKQFFRADWRERFPRFSLEFIELSQQLRL
jgi:hypothetical protein